MSRRNPHLNKLENCLGKQAMFVDATSTGYSAKFLCPINTRFTFEEEIKNVLSENEIPFVKIRNTIKHTFRGDIGQVAVTVPYV